MAKVSCAVSFPDRCFPEEFTCELFSYWKRIGNAVTHLRMDNAGENYLLAQEINKQKWQLDIEVEYTAHDTPQQNSLVEVAFNTIAPKAILLATLLDSLIIVNIDGIDKPRYEHDGISTPKWINDMKVFGEAGVVKLKTKISPKMDNKGKTCFLSDIH